MEYSKKYGKSSFAKHLRKTKGKWTKPMANSKSRLKTKRVMLDVILYDSIVKKNILESTTYVSQIASDDSLKHCLDMLDFMAAFSNNLERPDDGISWIILEMNSHDK